MASLLHKINGPADVKRLKAGELEELARELREYILEVVSVNGGHLGAALGAVELTVALHAVFDSPEDTFVFDVGHQVHAHKILTGRREAFRSFRQHGGLSGFSNKDESPHDPFTTGHGGASISTALGIAVANRKLSRKDRKVVAVIGDASLVSGMAFEAVNHAGHLKENLIVILNDNEMSISRTVGALSRHLNRIITNPFYNRVRKDVENLVRHVPKVGERMVRAAKKIDEGLKSILVPGLLFEELGFRYFGPLDGHDIGGLTRILRNLQKIKGPVMLHVVTKKGKGYKIAEADPARWHASTPFDVETGQVRKRSDQTSYTQVFGRAMCALADRNPKIAAITAAMCEGTGLVDFAERYPDRFFDVGIAEEHGVAFAAGLAKGGLRPFVAIYSTFLQRAHDQIIHDVALQNMPVVFCLDRAGLVGEDGPTHHGVFDIAYLRKVPGMTVMAPRDSREFEQMLRFCAIHLDGPIAVRYPRGAVAEETGGALKEIAPVPVQKGRAEKLRDGEDVLLFAYGSMVYPAWEAAKLLEKDGVSAAVVNARFAKPLDEGTLRRTAEGKALILSIEEGTVLGGIGDAVLEALPGANVRVLGIPDRFIDHGRRDLLLANLGLSAEKIRVEVLRNLGRAQDLEPAARSANGKAKSYGKSVQ